MSTTYYPVSLASAIVQASIDSCSHGDIVQLIAGTSTDWTSNALSVNKAITIQGAGIGITKIDISGNTFGSPTITLTKQTAGRIWIKDLTLTDIAGTHDDDPEHCIKVYGGYGTSYWPIIFKRVRFELTGWNW
jgi:hypothetical protein